MGLVMLFGALTAALIAASHKMKFSLGIGVVFLIGGISVAAQIGGPLWFNIPDLAAAYLPTGWLEGKLAGERF